MTSPKTVAQAETLGDGVSIAELAVIPVGPTIEDSAAPGLGATLLPGITIGRGSIVGAASVVTKDVESYTPAVGVPARFAKRLDPADGH